MWGAWALIAACVAGFTAIAIVAAAEHLALRVSVVDGDAMSAATGARVPPPAAAARRTLALNAAAILGAAASAPLVFFVVASVLPALSDPGAASPAALELCWLLALTSAMVMSALVAVVAMHGVRGAHVAHSAPRLYGALLLSSGALLTASAWLDNASLSTGAGDNAAAARALVAFLHLAVAVALAPHRVHLGRVAAASSVVRGGGAGGAPAMQQSWVLVVAAEAAAAAYASALCVIPLLVPGGSNLAPAVAVLLLSPILLLVSTPILHFFCLLFYSIYSSIYSAPIYFIFFYLQHQLPTRSPFVLSSAATTLALSAMSLRAAANAGASESVTTISLAVDLSLLLCALPANAALAAELWGVYALALAPTLLRCGGGRCDNGRGRGGGGRRRSCLARFAARSAWTSLLHGALASLAFVLSSVPSTQLLGLCGIAGAGIGALLRQAHTRSGEKVV